MTRKIAKTGKDFERRVADAYRHMRARKVEHDVDLAGNQIDVYVEMDTPDHGRHRVAVEVKDHIRPVGIQIINDFARIVDILRRAKLIDRGVIVSAAGFTRPGRRAAKEHDIQLLELADLDFMVVPFDETPDGGATEVNISQTSGDDRTEHRNLSWSPKFLVFLNSFSSNIKIVVTIGVGVVALAVIAIGIDWFSSGILSIPTLMPPATPTSLGISKVVIGIDETVVAEDNYNQEVECGSSLRIEVVELKGLVQNSMQYTSLSYNWYFNPGDSYNRDKIESNNHVVNYYVPCELDSQTVTVEVLKDGEPLCARSLVFDIER